MYRNFNEFKVIDASNVQYDESICLTLTYEDGETEYIFKYSNGCKNRVNRRRLVGLTRQEAVETIEEDYWSDRIQGQFMDEL